MAKISQKAKSRVDKDPPKVISAKKPDQRRKRSVDSDDGKSPVGRNLKCSNLSCKDSVKRKIDFSEGKPLVMVIATIMQQ